MQVHRRQLPTGSSAVWQLRSSRADTAQTLIGKFIMLRLQVIGIACVLLAFSGAAYGMVKQTESENKKKQK